MKAGCRLAGGALLGQKLLSPPVGLASSVLTQNRRVTARVAAAHLLVLTQNLRVRGPPSHSDSDAMTFS